MTTARPDYGLDAPGVVRNMFLAALGTGALAVVGRLRAIPALTSAGAWMAASFTLSGLLMIASSRIGKLRARDRLLDRLGFIGDERVLDVGCGHGLLLIGDGSVDIVVSSLAVHNVADRAGRRAAMREISRVLRPGGRVALMDIAHVGEYAADLRAAGLRSVRAGGWSPWIFPPTRTVTGTKAAT